MISNHASRCTRTVLRSGGPRRALSLAPTHRRPTCTEPPSLFALDLPPRPAARAGQKSEDWVCAVAEALPDGNLISWRFAHELSLKAAELELPSPRRTADNLDKLQSLLGLDRPAALRVARRKPGLLAQHPQTLRSNLRSIQTSSRVCKSTAQMMAETRPGLLLDKIWPSLAEPSSARARAH